MINRTAQNREAKNVFQCGRGLCAPTLLPPTDRGAKAPPTLGEPHRALITAQKFRGPHSTFAFELNFIERERTVAGREGERAAGPFTLNMSPKDLQFSLAPIVVAQSGERTWPGIESADFAFEHRRRLGPIETAGFAFEFGGVSRERRILRNARCRPVSKSCERFAQCCRRNLRQPIVDRSACFIGGNLDPFLE